jgi:hypothetical protein
MRYPHVYQLTVDKQHGFPLIIDSKTIFGMFRKLVKEQSEVESILKNEAKKLSENVADIPKVIRRLMLKRKIGENEEEFDTISPKKRITNPFFVYEKQNNTKRLETARLLVKVLFDIFGVELRVTELRQFAKDLSTGEINFDDLWITALSMPSSTLPKKTREEVGNLLTRIICFSITGQSFPDYFYGLQEQIFMQSYNFKESWDWIVQDWNVKPRIEHQPIEKLDLTLFPLKFDMHSVEQKDFGGVHRSGNNFSKFKVIYRLAICCKSFV